MRHPSKVGAFCSRKIARGASDNVLGKGTGPLRCGKHLKRGRQPGLRFRQPWYLRLRARARRDALRREIKRRKTAEA